MRIMTGEVKKSNIYMTESISHVICTDIFFPKNEQRPSYMRVLLKLHETLILFHDF